MGCSAAIAVGVLVKPARNAAPANTVPLLVTAVADLGVGGRAG